ncbi:MAG: hypothetical protein QOF30_2177 [Acidimicrobiaceae bacterium]|nr:hypothetical protein [Acidimicrobiaceae bacterium]
MNSHAHDEWVIVLEFIPPSPREPFAYGPVNALVEEMRGWQPVALFSTDRYALQLRVAAPRPADALRHGLALHDQAVRTVGLGHPVLVRSEILMDPEFDRQWDDAEQPAVPGEPAPAPHRVLCDEAYSATRALLQCSTAAEVTDVLVRFVETVGAQVRCGPGDAGPGQLAVDLSLGDGPRRHALVDSVSVAGLIIEQSLPALVSDARAVLSRRSQPDSFSDGPSRPRS